MARAVVVPWGAERAVRFSCPGCGSQHQVPITGPKAWGFNDNLENPTLMPSLLVSWDYNDGKARQICHLVLTDGNAAFQTDSTHERAGQTLPLPEVEDLAVEKLR